MAIVLSIGTADTPTAEDQAREDYLTLARTRFRIAADAETDLRKRMLEDKTFRASEQWPDAIRQQREAEGKPCLTVNRLPQFIRQITNQQRENKTVALVSAVDSVGDPATAQVLQGMIRHIEQQSQATVAYTTACEDQVTIGRGYIRILTEYADPLDMNQSLVIRRVRNPFTVYMDPACQELDYSDAMWGFVVADVSPEDYKTRWPDAPISSGAEFQSIGDQAPDWYPDGKYRVAEYWTVTLVPDTLLQLDTQDTLLLSQIPPEMVFQQGPTVMGLVVNGQPVRVVGQRETHRRVVRWSTITGVAMLDGNEDKTDGRRWPGHWIPIVPVIGEEIDLDGKLDLRGIVRDAKDPQRRYNYSVSATTEIAALAPKSPYVMADGQDEGHEFEWKHANTKNFSSLKYRPVDVNGQLVGPPQRNVQEPPIQAMVMLTTQADHDLMNVTGRYQASLGAPGPEQSGLAIKARQRQGDIGSYNFQDNLNVAISTVARYLVDLIPAVYDVPRVIRIAGEDDTETTVMVHAGQPPEAIPPGVQGVFNVGMGRFDIVVSSGANHDSKRQEFMALVGPLVQAFPQAAPIVLPMVARYMDMPFAKELAAKLNGPPPLPPEVQQQMQQMDEDVKRLTAELQQAQQTIQAKQIESAAAVQQQQIAAQSRVDVAQIAGQSAAQRAQLASQSAIQAAQIDGQTALQRAQVAAEAQLQQTAMQDETKIRTTQMQIQAEMALARIQAIEADITARRDALNTSSPSAG